MTMTDSQLSLPHSSLAQPSHNSRNSKPRGHQTLQSGVHYSRNIWRGDL